MYYILSWLLIWAGYNTNYFFGNPKKVDRWRGLLPLIVGITALFFVKQFSLVSPLSLMLGYACIGIIGTLFINYEYRMISWWWALMFISPILLLLTTNDHKNIYLLMNVNWVISALLSLFLMGYFLFQPGVLKGITVNAFFSSRVRPFEGWLSVPFEAKILGMIGTRPTGLARYSAVASLIALCLFTTYQQWYYFIGFLLFTFILLFSKGKTEIISFIASMGLVLFFSHTLLALLIPIYLVIIAIALIIVFGNIPYKLVSSKNDIKIEYKKDLQITPKKEYTSISYPPEISIKRITTLSGRTISAWPRAMRAIKKNPFIGYGFNSERLFIKDYLGRPGTVDSTILNALLQSGIIGTILFISSIVFASVMWYNLSSSMSLVLLECLAVGVFIILRGITQSFSFYSADWLLLVPIIAYLSL